MTPVVQPQFSEDLLAILKETFAGPAPTGPSAFIEKGTGLFQTLEGTSAEVASVPLHAGGSTIAAHSEHIRFYVAVHYKLMLGSSDPIDWNESWRIKSVNDAEWNVLRQELRTVYRAVVEYLRGLDKWSADEFGLTMAIVAHSAYHLGAIRQLLLAAQASK